MRTCTRRLEFDAAHRVMRHESKCRNLHGHRYVVDITCAAPELDQLGRVVDFGVVKTLVGTFIDERWDHGCLLHKDDHELLELCERNGWRVYTLASNPTAETLAETLHSLAGTILASVGIEVVAVRVYETPNCWSDYP